MRYIVVGAGHAGGFAVAALRQSGFEGEIVLFGEEPHLPYQRPPLSKQYLAGEWEVDRVYLRKSDFYEQSAIQLELGNAIAALDTERHTVVTADHREFEYDELLLTVGSRPRVLPLPGAELDGVFYLRTLNDVQRIRERMTPGKSLVIVGGGYIGLEVASAGIKAGLAVTVLEMEERVLQRVTTPEMSAFYTDVHSEHGVTVKVNAQVTGFEGTGSVTHVSCADGSLIEADLAIIGAGIVPNVELAEAAGIECDNGIMVDEHCRTSAEHVLAAGDCTNHPNALLGRRVRLESVPNATDQARVAAANMCGDPKVHDSVPWFWSDQYDLKLQMVGFSSEGDTQVLRGNMADREFAVFYLKDGHLIAADAVNCPRDFLVYKRLVADRAKIAPERLRDTTTPAKELAP
jgi:3-phenylpropionate/trans-cinnamate dioxygenase ferredoxin reductase subunit